MKFFTGLAVSAALVCATSVANAQAGGKARVVSDVDGPYIGGPPAEVPEPPPPAPRYYDRGYYGPDRSYYGPGYRDDRYGPERGYAPDYSYAPALLPTHEVYAILRENGFSPLGIPRQRGYTYVIAVLDRGGEDGRLIIDGRNGRIIRFVPASQWGQAYDRMRYEPGPAGPGPAPSRNPAGALPPPTVIKASPQAPAAVPPVANRSAAVPAPKPAPMAARPAEPPQQKSAANEAHPAQPAPRAVGTVGEAKPATPQLQSTTEMPQVQGFE
jgi:hypothetical protein